MDVFADFTKYRKPDPARLMARGFREEGGLWRLALPMKAGGFSIALAISPDGSIGAEITDPEEGSEYVLWKTDATGSFVGSVRAEAEEIAGKIVAECYLPDIHKTRQAKLVLDHALVKWGAEPEYLWPDTPDCCVLRRQDNQKWFAAVLSVDGSKLGLAPGRLEIIDLRMAKGKSAEVLALPGRFPGWHMNKKSWYTIVFDSGVDDGSLLSALETSRELAGGK